MAVLRFFAGPIVEWISNTGLLLVSAILAGAGLLMLSFAGNIVMVGVAATVFALGVCYFWPTMLGTVAERVPKGGALALALLGGTGAVVVGVITTPLMGKIADQYLHRELVYKSEGVDREKQTASVLGRIESSYLAWQKSLGDSKQDQLTRTEIDAAVADVRRVLEEYQRDGKLPELETANALRSAIKNGPGDNAEGVAAEALNAKQDAKTILDPAENHGGLMSFRYVAPLSVMLVVVFGVMYVQDRGRRK